MDRRRFLRTTGRCVAGALGASQAAGAALGKWIGKGEGQNLPQDYGPWNRNLELFESGDGSAFRKVGVFIERGGVPALARADDGSLWAVFQWFPLSDRNAFDQVACVVSRDFGLSWTKPAVVHVAGMPTNLYRVFDPTLVPLPGGGFRLYFSSERINPQNPRGNRAIFSAVSSDGIHYEFEPGQRFGFEAAETFDCAVAFLAGAWHLYCPIPGAEGWGYHAVSADGQAFERKPDVFLAGNRQWLGNVLSFGAGLSFYGSGGQAGWSGYSTDGFHWSLISDRTGLGGDPAVVWAAEGRCLAVATGPLRPDAVPGPPVFSKGGGIRRDPSA